MHLFKYIYINMKVERGRKGGRGEITFGEGLNNTEEGYLYCKCSNYVNGTGWVGGGILCRFVA